MESEHPLVQVSDVIYIYLPEERTDEVKKQRADVIKVKKAGKSFKYKLQLSNGSIIKSKLEDVKWKLAKKRKNHETVSIEGEISKRFRPDLYNSILPLKLYERRQRFVNHFPVESLKHILAPMVGASELPFRLLCRKYGATLAYTPMMHSEHFAADPAYRAEEFQVTPQDRPLVAHFAANSPEVLLAAAKQVEHCCDAIDLNLGCPQRVAYVGHFGSFLLDPADRPLVLSMVSTLSTHLSIPVFVKIRLLDSFEDTCVLVQQLYEAGAEIVAVHGRYRVNLTERTGPTARDGPAHLDQIAQLCSRFPHIPLITNGNVRCPSDLQTNLQLTNAYGIMVAEAILDNPALFSGQQVDKLVLMKEYMAYVAQHETKLKSVVFHFRRMCKELLVQYQLLEDCINAKDLQTIKDIVSKLERYQGHPELFQYDEQKARDEKERLKRLKEEANRRKQYEDRMIRKAKREGKAPDYYLLQAAKHKPTIELIQKLKQMKKEEAFEEWKQKYSQHCWSYHMEEKCPRDRGCAFLHMECTFAGKENEGVEEGRNMDNEVFG